MPARAETSADAVKAAYAAFLSGRGYAARLDVAVPGTSIAVDVAAVLPRMRDLKLRLKRGFVPTGVLQHLLDAEWHHIEEIIALTGYETGYVASLMKEALENHWVEMEPREGLPHFRVSEYRVPARECVLAWVGTENLRQKMEDLAALEGAYSRASFIFPYAIDDGTTEEIVSRGAGVVRYHLDFGVFQVLIPPERRAVENTAGFALIAEYVLYNNVWIMTEEII